MEEKKRSVRSKPCIRLDGGVCLTAWMHPFTNCSESQSVFVAIIEGPSIELLISSQWKKYCYKLINYQFNTPPCRTFSWTDRFIHCCMFIVLCFGFIEDLILYSIIFRNIASNFMFFKAVYTDIQFYLSVLSNAIST